MQGVACIPEAVVDKRQRVPIHTPCPRGSQQLGHRLGISTSFFTCTLIPFFIFVSIKTTISSIVIITLIPFSIVVSVQTTIISIVIITLIPFSIFVSVKTTIISIVIITLIPIKVWQQHVHASGVESLDGLYDA